MRIAHSLARSGLIMLLLLTISLPAISWENAVSTVKAAELNQPLENLPRCGAGEAGSADFTLAAVGDLLLHYNIQATGNRLGYDYIFEKVRPYLGAADLTYANFEGVITPGQESGDFPFFAYRPELATAAKQAGIDIVSTANNHALDRGPGGIDSTIDYLDQAGLLHHGTTAKGRPARPYVGFELTAASGVKLKGSLLSFTYGTNGVPDPYHQVNSLWDGQGRVRQSVKDAIKIARQETELVVVAVHWGEEYQFLPSQQQQQGARELAEAGADIVLGDHPHVLQPVDLLEINNRSVLVIYSLGNFVAAQEGYRPQTQASMIFYVGIRKGADNKVSVTGYRYLPVYIENNTRPAPILPGQHPAAYSHILRQLRDPAGKRIIAPLNSLSTGRVEICPRLTFPEAPGLELAGDFAVYFQTLGNGSAVRSPAESLSVVGLPISGVHEEMAGDCQHRVKVVYTERQRLEWQPEAPWPYRVIGTHLGAEVYFNRYKLPWPSPAAIPRKMDLTRTTAFASPNFAEFFQRYGGLGVFGYPISDGIEETNPATGEVHLIQYFERARFEQLLSPPPSNSNPLYRVQFGLLGREYRGIEHQCAT